MKGKFKKFLSSDAFDIAVEKLSEEEMLYAFNYPIEELFAYATNDMTQDAIEELEKKFDENAFLLSAYAGIDMRIQEFNIQTLEEYKVRFYGKVTI